MVVLTVCTVMLYGRALAYDYVWDDQMYLGGLHLYRGLAGMVRAVVEPFFPYPDYYRPLAMLSFVISAEPLVQHGINILLHAVNVVLVFLCARALMPHEAAESKAGVAAAALGALMFAVHPVCVEPVAWVSGRFDTLMCSFVLGTCLAALGGELTHRRLALVFVLFACAMGCKESAIGLPVALPFLLLLKWRLAGIEAVQIKVQTGVLVRVLAMLALAVALYVSIRLLVVHSLFVRDGAQVTFAGSGVLDKLNIVALAVTEFVKLIVNPWSYSAPLHPFEYGAGGRELLPQALVVVVAVLALLALAVLKKPKVNFPLALLAALAMGWPVLHLVGIPNGENIISDRYVLAPLALLLTGLAAIAGTWLARRAPGVGVYTGVFALLWTGALAMHTHATIPLWRDDAGLWKFARQQAPDSVVAHKNYVITLMQQERWEEAETELHGFWDRHPEQFQKMSLETMNMWMQLRAHLGDLESALQISGMIEKQLNDGQKLKAIPPQRLGRFYSARGEIAGKMGEWALAEDYFAKAAQMFPADRGHAFSYAQALFMTGQTEQAEEVFNRALAGLNGEEADRALEWRKTWQPPAKAAGRGASAAASAPAP